MVAQIGSGIRFVICSGSPIRSSMMNILFLIALGVFAYLLFVLLKPEKF
ncbi:MAG: potassium-transporting ATPase subunit F [Chitinophagaceae bacterium]|nr:potassium-transporting ATPase subunit F [Chitinophagaceae bacterium]MBN8668730.1 potassium-transporting ATPase subunit F [Chitinophagales bacterium]